MLVFLPISSRIVAKNPTYSIANRKTSNNVPNFQYKPNMKQVAFNNRYETYKEESIFHGSVKPHSSLAGNRTMTELYPSTGYQKS